MLAFSLFIIQVQDRSNAMQEKEGIPESKYGISPNMHNQQCKDSRNNEKAQNVGTSQPAKKLKQHNVMKENQWNIQS